MKRYLGVAIAAAVALAGANAVAKMKIEVKHDKSVDFKPLKTWDWQPERKNPVVASAAEVGDLGAARRMVEPPIVAAVERELSKKGYRRDTSGNADFLVAWHVAIGAGLNESLMGQYYGDLTGWGPPTIGGGPTTYLRIYEQGALVLDIVMPKLKSVVWWGSATAELKRENTDAERAKRIDDAVKKLLEKFPPK